MPNRVRLPSGDIVGRGTARTLGAKELGYKNAKSYHRSDSTRDNKYFDTWANTPHGRDIIAKEKAIANREGRRYSENELKQRLISARNQQPHGDRYRTGQPGRPAGPAFQDFLDRYDIDDDRDIYY
jgi:hypothetical protein